MFNNIKACVYTVFQIGTTRRLALLPEIISRRSRNFNKGEANSNRQFLISQRHKIKQYKFEASRHRGHELLL